MKWKVYLICVHRLSLETVSVLDEQFLLDVFGYLPISGAWNWQSEGTWQVPAVPTISTPVQVTSSLVCCCAVTETACPVFSPLVDGDVR